jgi:hypothetical protein
MAGRVVDCPNCGGRVEFKAGTSLLSVCSYCSSAVARVGDDVGELEILGKVAPLAEIGSPLSLGVRGELHRKDFIVVGRLQLNYGDGPWNEWYLAFDDGRWAWLAEAQGRVYVTFEKDLEELKENNPMITTGGQLPEFDQWQAGTKFHFGGQTLAITERRKARFVSAEGELPFSVPLDSEFAYCDFEGPRGIFGTLDFGDSPQIESVYFGRQHAYEDLFDKDILDDIAAAEALAGVAMNCPNCGGAVELQAPNESERVTCGTCESLLDCSKGNALYLLSAADTKGKDPTIPLGSVARHGGEKWTVFGYLVRSVTVYSVRYPWEEYLLRGDKGGYRWLICSDGHWTWSEPVSAAEVDLKTKRKATYRGQNFRHFQTGTATVDYLRGEFYWKVKLGDKTETMDFISPPRLLSYERIKEDGEDEISWSIGQYLTQDETRNIFGGKVPIPRPSSSVAPHEPNRFAETRDKVSTLAIIFTGLLVAAAVLLTTFRDSAVVFETNKKLQFFDRTKKESLSHATVLTEPFEITRTGNLSIRLKSNVSNNWLFLNGALINEDKGEVRYFNQQVSYYSGYSGGESWSEGSRSETVYLGTVKPGKYLLSFRPETQKVPEVSYSITVKQGVFMQSHLVFFLLLVWALPLFVRGRHNRFEHRRWADSDYG